MYIDNVVFDEPDEIEVFHKPDYILTLDELPKNNKLFYGIFISEQVYDETTTKYDQKIYEILMVRKPKVIKLQNNVCKVKDCWYKVIRPLNTISRHIQYIETERPIYWKYK
jgi:hypothetical protein